MCSPGCPVTKWLCRPDLVSNPRDLPASVSLSAGIKGKDHHPALLASSMFTAYQFLSASQPSGIAGIIYNTVFIPSSD